MFSQFSDASGTVTFDLPWQGTYVVVAEHQDPSRGERIDTQQQQERYDVKSFGSTLSFHQRSAAAPLPHAPSQLPASEVARLKNAAD